MNASYIVLLDDTCASIVQATRWGRNVLCVIRKFLQFQLGINMVAVITTFLGSVVSGTAPLSTVQLLWINLIMDSFGAIALASDDPDPKILELPPQRRTDSLLTLDMKRYICVQTVYQTIVSMILLMAADTIWPIDTTGFHAGDHSTFGSPSVRSKTMVFNTFIFMQMANLTCARNINGELNIFAGITKNKYFIGILFIICGIQLFAITVAASLFNSVALSINEWGICLMFAALNMPVVFFTRVAFKLFDLAVTPRPSARVAAEKTLDRTGSSHSVIKMSEDVEDADVKVERKPSLPEIVRGKIRTDMPMPTKSKSIGSLKSLKD
jgi:Ca2+-transporting ATPase